MKKLFIYFVLISSLFCGISRASSCFSSELIKWATETDPNYVVDELFKRGFKDNDYRDRTHISKAASTIENLYPDRNPNYKNLRKQAVNAWGRCMREQTVNGRKKYTEQDINLLINFSKIKLGLN